jgi:hypothetical protein
VSDPSSSPLPDVYKATLTQDQLDAYLADVEAHSDGLTIRRRGTSGDMQLRYRRDGREFIDTVLRREDGFELIRM